MSHFPLVASPSERSVKKPLSFQFCFNAPVTLYRPLKLFGKTFKVHISTGLTLSPATVLHVAMGLSLLQLLRRYKFPADKNDNVRPEQALKDLLRGATGRNKLSVTTQKGVMKLFGPLLPEDALTAVLLGKEPPTPLAWQSEWDMALQGLGEPGDDVIYQLVQRLAMLDRIAFSARQLPEAAGVALLEPYIGRLREGWLKYNPNLSLAVAILVDTSLQTLAFIEGAAVSEHSRDKSKTRASRISPLLASGKKPLGHWLLNMQAAANCANLEEFSSLTLRKGIKHHDHALGHDLLKKWSSCQQMMPMEAAHSVLTTVGRGADRELELGRFALARFLSFLCDFVVAGSQGEPPSWKVAQEQIHRRYSELFDQGGASRKAQ